MTIKKDGIEELLWKPLSEKDFFSMEGFAPEEFEREIKLLSASLRSYIRGVINSVAKEYFGENGMAEFNDDCCDFSQGYGLALQNLLKRFKGKE